MLDKISGNALVLGDNIDTDVLYPGKYLPILEPEEMAKHALEGYSSEFPDKIQPGDIIVAGSNFGCGSSREQAATCLKFAGVACVVAKSFARIFYRNAINLGLPIVALPDCPLVSEGDVVTVDYAQGQFVTPNATVSFPALPPEILAILSDGGLIPHVKKAMEK